MKSHKEPTEPSLKVDKGSQIYHLLKARLAVKREQAAKKPGFYRVYYDDYADLLNILEHLL